MFLGFWPYLTRKAIYFLLINSIGTHIASVFMLFSIIKNSKKRNRNRSSLFSYLSSQIYMNILKVLFDFSTSVMSFRFKNSVMPLSVNDNRNYELAVRRVTESDKAIVVVEENSVQSFNYTEFNNIDHNVEHNDNSNIEQLYIMSVNTDIKYETHT